MTTLTNERLDELISMTNSEDDGCRCYYCDVNAALLELRSLRASQPSEETKVTVLDALRFMRMRTRPEARRAIAALTELERMGWK